jgi:hypothetical protein
MALMFTAGSIDRRGAIPRREPRSCREPTDVADVADNAGGSGRPDAVQVSQAGAGLAEQVGELLVRGLVTDRNVLAPPGTSSSDTLCSRLTAAVRVTPSSSRRSAGIRTTTT